MTQSSITGEGDDDLDFVAIKTHHYVTFTSVMTALSAIMNRMQQLRATFLFALVSVAVSCSRSTERIADANTPIILISIDTLRSDRLSCYGYNRGSSPNIDAFRRDAILFERAYSHCPMTLPSHASIFTGLLPTEHGVRNNIGYAFPRERLTTLAEIFRGRGYRTAAAVSSYVLRSETGIDDGFELYDDAIPVAAEGAASQHQRPGQATLSAASKWLEKNHGGPLFFFFHIYEPHAPYEPPEPYKSRHQDPYDGEVAAADAITGAFLDSLKRLGIYDRAAIVLLSDHGEGLWDHGEDQHGVLLYRESVQVPLLIKLPRSERAGTTVSRPAQLADVFHTLLALGGVTASERSLLGDSPARPIYAET
ncbi:MAG TPA: sulfatase, partial [Thermoanaerobaculia bacterium]|nr:sulfatase [Thermoanaerobaculia bacterium]